MVHDLISAVNEATGGRGHRHDGLDAGDEGDSGSGESGDVDHFCGLVWFGLIWFL
jgi:hypothetical protein